MTKPDPPFLTAQGQVRTNRPDLTRTPGAAPFVPTLIRFVILTGGVVAVIYGAMYFLVDSVQVQPREMSEIVEIPKAAPK